MPNPSFEDTIDCPYFFGSLDPIENWFSCGNSVDCYHTCSETVNAPNSPNGFQQPRSGESMIGLVSYVWEQSSGWPNYREYLCVELSEPLSIGERYFISFYINCAGYLPGWQIIASNKFGVRFSNEPYFYDENSVPVNSAHIFSNSIISDTVNWYNIAGEFIADSAYSYLVLGNFFDENNTDTIIFGGQPFGGSAAYYYLDDVCVSSDSIFANNWSSVFESKNNNKYSIYPNPVSDVLTIESEYPIEFITIWDLIGQPVVEAKILDIRKHENLDVSDLKSGTYIFEIRTNRVLLFQRLIKL